MSPQPAVSEHGQLLCPLHAPDDPYSDRELYLVRTSYVPLELVDIGWTDPRGEAEASGWPGAPTSSTWEVRCIGGHVLANPAGDSEANEDTELPTASEWELLRTFLERAPHIGLLGEVWHLATCEQCEPRLPQPFREQARRDEWATAHTEGAGHTVTLTTEVRP